jgi:alpha-ketoglutarate-dependent taurine dioxygenase
MLPTVIEGKSRVDELVRLLTDEQHSIRETLLADGAILFRGFAVTKPEELAAVAGAFAPELKSYVGGDSPRKRVHDRVYTSTEYPASQDIALHTEMSYWHTWPSHLFFVCAAEPTRGGETPLADCRGVLAKLDPAIRSRFVERGVLYSQHLHGGQGLGKSWQETFETEDRAVVEAQCRTGGVECQWRDDGALVTNLVRPAVIQHPRTGETVWFNQADHWHPSNLDPDTREALVEMVGDDLPHNARFGDGGAIDDADLDAIRACYRAEAKTFGWKLGDVLLVDNLRVAHGRNTFEGPRKILVAMT